MQKAQPKKLVRKPQSQNRPGLAGKINFLPVFDHPHVAGSAKIKNKIALIIGGMVVLAGPWQYCLPKKQQILPLPT